MSNFMKICPVGAELFQEDGRTDMTKLIVVFFLSSPDARLKILPSNIFELRVI